MKPPPYRLILYPVVAVIMVVALAASWRQSPIAVQQQPVVITTPVLPPANPTTCLRGPLVETEEVVIGAIYPLSDRSYMNVGFAMQGATNLALAEINEQGGVNGKPVRLVVYDSGASPAQGARFAERLATIDCAAAIVGVFHSDVALAVKDVAIRYDLPVVFADPYADEITGDHAPEVFRIAPTRSMLIEMMGRWLATVGDYNQDGELLTVLLVENSRYGTMRSELAQELLPAYGIKPIVFPIDLPTTDFSPLIARIVALDKLPDAVFMYLHNGDNLPLQQQLLAAGIGPLRSTLLVAPPSALDHTTFWEQTPDGIYTVVTQIGPWPSTVTPMGQRFADLFQQHFNRWPEGPAFEAYDALWLVADAIKRANSLAAEEIIRALEQSNIELASGRYTFPYGSTNPPDGKKVPNYMWHQWPEPQLLYLQYTAVDQSSRTAPVVWPPIYQTVEGPLAPEIKARRRE